MERQEALAKAIGLRGDLLFKREDMHPYGSHKGRSIPVMIDHYAATGDRRFAISSSGNAGLAAALYVKQLNTKIKKMKKQATMSPVDLDVFIGMNAALAKANKLKELADSNIRILVKERPVQALSQAVKDGMRSLRQSIDDVALTGYAELVAELPEKCSVFMATSSGTTAQAIAASGRQMHIVQTSSCHPMSAAFEQYDGPHERSTADAIVDTVAARKPVLVPLIEKSGGRGWTVTNDEIAAAQDMISTYCGDLEISTNSAAALAGLMQAIALGTKITSPVVCMICGD